MDVAGIGRAHWVGLIPMWPHLAPILTKDAGIHSDVGKSKGIPMPMLETWLEKDWETVRMQDL